MKANKQKYRVQRKIRNWYMAACKAAIESEEVGQEWRAVWKGMRELN